MKKSIMLTVAAITALTATAASAGTIKKANGSAFVPWGIAQEIVDGVVGGAFPGARTDISTKLGSTEFVYSPVDIPLTTLTDGLLQFKLPAGNAWAIKGALKQSDGSGLNVCEVGANNAGGLPAISDSATLVYKLDASNQLVFDKGQAGGPAGALSGSITNIRKYTLGKYAGAQAAVAGATANGVNAIGSTTPSIAFAGATNSIITGARFTIAGDATVYTVTAGTAVAGAGNIAIAITPALAKATAGTEVVTFAANGSLCMPLAYGDIQTYVPTGVTGVNMDVKLGISSDQLHDFDAVSSTKIIDVRQQYTAAIGDATFTNGKLDAKITPSSIFTQFKGTHTNDAAGAFIGTTTKDNLLLNLKTDTTTPLDDKSYTRLDGVLIGPGQDLTLGTDVLRVVLTGATPDFNGITTAAITGVTSAATNACTVTAATKTIACTLTRKLNATANESYVIAINTNGTSTLTEKTWTVSVETDFADVSATPVGPLKDHAIAAVNWPLIPAGTAAGDWTYDATVVYVPAVRFDSTGTLGNKLSETYFRIFSTDTTPNANKVTAVVYGAGAAPVTVNVNCYDADGFTPLVTGNTIPLNSSKGGCYFTASSIKAAADLAGATWDQTGTVSTFPVKLIITSNISNLYGYATQVVNGAVGQRRVPLFSSAAKAGLDN